MENNDFDSIYILKIIREGDNKVSDLNKDSKLMSNSEKFVPN